MEFSNVLIPTNQNRALLIRKLVSFLISTNKNQFSFNQNDFFNKIVSINLKEVFTDFKFVFRSNIFLEQTYFLLKQTKKPETTRIVVSF